jgi:hypothetical protein
VVCGVETATGAVLCVPLHDAEPAGVSHVATTTLTVPEHPERRPSAVCPYPFPL